MTVATDVSGVYFWVYLNTAKVIGASSFMSRDATVAEDVVRRSYSNAPTWAVIASDATVASRTAVSEGAPILVNERHVDGEVIDEIASYDDLSEGWDGDQAAKPDHDATYDAIRFVWAASGLKMEITPTLHVDGSVILELEDRGSIRFFGRGKTAYAFSGADYGEADFNGFAIPATIKHALNV